MHAHILTANTTAHTGNCVRNTSGRDVQYKGLSVSHNKQEITCYMVPWVLQNDHGLWRVSWEIAFVLSLPLSQPPIKIQDFSTIS